MTVPSPELKKAFPLFELPEMAARYNIAPTQDVLVVRQQEGEAARGTLLRWGLVPWWAEDLSIGNQLINARAESIAQKPAFREAFVKRRCLVLADGFYEWKKIGKKDKLPFHFHLKDRAPFAFAGLWESWKEKDAESETKRRIESCTIITTEANDVVAPLHDRMPVILERRDYQRWLDPAPADPAILQEMLRPYAADKMAATPASKKVNSPVNEGEELLRAEPEEEAPSLF